ncbi:MAG: class I SAM-dependent methyltransferase [Desulfobacterales bacterium]|nr:class I SAM-dependent methyltransferase [Desulfobacterales bacterium]
MNLKKVILKPGREKSALRQHPWIFSGAIKKAEEKITKGEIVTVVTSDGKEIAKGSYSPESQIRIRIWTFDTSIEISKNFLKKRIIDAINFRKLLFQYKNVSAYRIINSESDLIPGLIVDKYEDFLVCQFLSAGVELFKSDIIQILSEIMPVSGIYERSDSEVRLKEGLKQTKGVLYGKEPPDIIQINENGLKFFVDIKDGHKTGFYLDQRDNRNYSSQFAKNSEVLNCFSYTGGFSIYALNNGAKKVVNIDTSNKALEIGLKNAEANKISLDCIENISGDVFHTLRKFRDSGRKFDLIILDPPKFADSAKNLQKAIKGYKDINWLAFKILKSYGTLMTFSCSGIVSPELFQSIIANSSLDANRNSVIIRHLFQASDHIVNLNFPEGAYLKGIIVKTLH